MNLVIILELDETFHPVIPYEKQSEIYPIAFYT